MEQSNLTDDIWTATASESVPAPAQKRVSMTLRRSRHFASGLRPTLYGRTEALKEFRPTDAANFSQQFHPA